jgi:transporter family-2 protein
MRIFYVLLAILAGCALPFQGTINGRLGKSIDSPVYASFFSFLAGTFALMLYSLVTQGPIRLQNVRQVPAYEWSGGIIGAFYVLVVILMLPRLGAALTFSLVVAGQMVVSLLLDHTGILVAAQHPINIWRALGLALIIGGVILVRKF